MENILFYGILGFVAAFGVCSFVAALGEAMRGEEER